ncbi:hypothetical protein ACHAXR_011951 [Thalassiosira sp. AJA248-18]
MASFKAAAVLLAAVVAVPSTSAFTPHAPSATRSARPLFAADEAFQRSLLEAQLANGGATAHVVTSVNGDIEQQPTAVDPSPSPTVVAVDNTSIQNSILRIAASTDRGQYAKPSQKDQVLQFVSQLESNAPAIEPSLSSGTWELVYSNTQLFRSSPFFLAGRSTCKTPEQAQQYNWFCEMHRAALAISTIGVVRQIITSGGKIVNEFEVKVGAIPFLSDFLPTFRYSGGLPFTIDGAIVSTADATPKSSTEWELFMDTVEIKGSNIPILRRVLDSENVALKSRDLSKVLEENVDSYEVPKPVLTTVFIDDGMRIVKDEDDNVFVYGRVSDSEEPTDYSGVMADLGVGSLLEGFNDAVSKVYL